MTIKERYYVYEVSCGETRYLRIDSNGFHWYETNKVNASDFTINRAQKLTLSLNNESLRFRGYKAYGYCPK